MKRYEVTLQLDVPDNQEIGCLGRDIVTALDETWNVYKNITVTNTLQLSISHEEAIEEIKDLISLKLHDGSVLIEDLFEIINKVN
jgi:hypothetical protein